jgi:GH24 family phage-related lysozyme (muramidase)
MSLGQGADAALAPYVYVKNRPTSLVDPNGMQEVDPIFREVTKYSSAKLQEDLSWAKDLEAQKFNLLWPDPNGKQLWFTPMKSYIDALSNEIDFRDKLTQQIVVHEGGRINNVYLDSKKIPTVGVGFNLKRADAPKKIAAAGANYEDVLSGKATLSNQQIDKLLQSDLDDIFFPAAQKLVKNYSELPRKARLVVMDMMFNLGETRFTRFKDLRAALEAKDYKKAADEMENSKWYSDVKSRGKEMVEMMRSLAPEK